MTTITIQHPGATPITISLGDDLRDISTGTVSPSVAHHRVDAALVTAPDAPRATIRPGWKRHIRHYAPGLAVGVIAGLLIVSTRGPSVPDANAQQLPAYGYGTTTLPPLSGGPVRSVGTGTGMPSQSAGQAMAQGQMLQPYGTSTSGGYGSIAQSSTTQPPQGNQGGAPTESGAPVDGTTPVDGAPTPSKKAPAANKPPFGLEP